MLFLCVTRAAETPTILRLDRLQNKKIKKNLQIKAQYQKKCVSLHPEMEESLFHFHAAKAFV